MEEVEKWKKWKSKFKVLFVLSSLSLLACRPAEQDTGLPTGWRLPTPEELAAEPIRAESPTRDARASADFNGDGIQDEALLVVSTNALREGLIVRLSCGDACAQWITLDTVDWGNQGAITAPWMGVEVLPPGAYRYTCVERDNDCVATPGANENERPTMTLERPAISYFRFESAASFFYWEQGGFVRVWISD